MHLEQLKPGCLDAGEHAVQRGLIRQRSRQDGALSARLRRARAVPGWWRCLWQLTWQSPGEYPKAA